MDIFERSLAGLPVNQAADADGPLMTAALARTRRLLARLNSHCGDEAETCSLLREIGIEIDETARVRPAFHTDFGHFIRIGAHAFVNEDCLMMDRGGIDIGERALIGPRVNLITETHELDRDRRAWIVSRPIRIGDNAWIGAAATILPGVTVGENAVVGAGSVVTNNVPPNTVVAGNPARIINTIPPPSSAPARTKSLLTRH